MKPDVGQILQSSTAHIMGEVVPLLPPGYAQGTAGLLGFMLLLSAQEYERGAEIRVRENAELRALFADCAGIVTDAPLRAELEAAARTRDDSLAISALNESNYALRRLLIALHAYVDGRGDAEARDAARRIWQAMKIFSARRVLASPSG